MDRLRQQGAVLSSFVAETGNRIVGHIVFSRMWIDTPLVPIPAVALAPLAVLPEHQRQGTGAQLIRHALDELRQNGEAIVIVLGSPRYYQRFGFSTGKARALISPFHPDAFMALELVPGVLDEVAGPVRYPSAFGL